MVSVGALWLKNIMTKAEASQGYGRHDRITESAQLTDREEQYDDPHSQKIPELQGCNV